MSYDAFCAQLTTLYTLYRVVNGMFHPADSFLTECILTHKPAARWLVRFIRTQPAYRKSALATVARLNEDVTRWWGPCLLSWSKRQERIRHRSSAAFLNIN